MRGAEVFVGLGSSALNISTYPRSGFSGGGGTSRKSFFLPDRGRAIVGVMVAGNFLVIVDGMVEGKVDGEVEGKLLCMVEGRLLGGVCEGILLCDLAFKIRRKNESRSTAKIANLTHESIAAPNPETPRSALP